jgi:hypothetical protein
LRATEGSAAIQGGWIAAALARLAMTIHFTAMPGLVTAMTKRNEKVWR